MENIVNKNINPIKSSSGLGKGFFNHFFKRKYAFSVEVALIGIVSILFYKFLVNYIPGGIDSTDVLLYMNLGINNIKDTFVLNRYMHIFLQKLFIETAITPVVGEHNYWSFLVTSATVLTYCNGRQLFQRRSIIRGLIAVSIFLSINLFLLQSGSVMPDFSALLLVNIILGIYLASINKDNASIGLILALGAVLNFAFKTKETTLFPCIILIPGIGFVADRFNLPLFRKNILIMILGFLIGIIGFAVLNGLILKDPLWGLRVGEIKEFFSTYIGGGITNATNQQEGWQNWYSTFLLGIITIPFVFYLLSGISTLKDVIIPRRLVWLMPLAAIAFIIPTANANWGGRFFLPIVPIISILGSAVINEVVLIRNRREILKTGILVLLGFVLYSGIRIGMRYLLPPLGIDLVGFLYVILNPLLFTAILGVIFLMPNSSYARNLVLLVILLLLTIPVMINNFKTAIHNPISYTRYQEITHPFRVFSSEIKYTPEMHLATSKLVWPSSLTKNIDEFMCLFNVYFDAGATRSSFLFSDDLDQLISQAMDQKFKYILITENEWRYLLSEPGLATRLQGAYRFLIEGEGKFVLLTRN